MSLLSHVIPWLSTPNQPTNASTTLPPNQCHQSPAAHCIHHAAGWGKPRTVFTTPLFTTLLFTTHCFHFSSNPCHPLPPPPLLLPVHVLRYPCGQASGCALPTARTFQDVQAHDHPHGTGCTSDDRRTPGRPPYAWEGQIFRIHCRRVVVLCCRTRCECSAVTAAAVTVVLPFPLP
jgi:hypothetical protein